MNSNLTDEQHELSNQQPRMARPLPIVTIDGKLYFQDDRLHEFRAVDNPHSRIVFGDAFPDPPSS